MASKGQGAPKFRNKLQPNQEYVSIKLTLNQILKREHSNSFRQVIYDRCVAATKFQYLASLLLLFQTNRSIDDGNEGYFNQNGETAINHCFMGVNLDNIENPIYGVPTQFKALIRQYMIQLPTRNAMTNSFRYMVELYTQNLRTNLRRWCFKRVRTFFNMKRYQFGLMNIEITDRDVKNALAAIFCQRDATRDEEERFRMDHLLNELVDIGGDDCLNMRNFMNNNWFKSISMWIKMQRQFEEFNIDYNPVQFHGQFGIPRPPKINNFAAIPICSPKLKHIRIDHTEFLEIATRKKMDAIKTFYAGGDPDARRNYWNQVFEMDKINRIGKQHKNFHFQFVSDSVAVSLLYVKNKSLTDTEIEQRISDDFNNDLIIYELGIDPGMKTWNATVRRTVRTNKEVRIIICYSCMLTKFYVNKNNQISIT